MLSISSLSLLWTGWILVVIINSAVCLYFSYLLSEAAPLWSVAAETSFLTVCLILLLGSVVCRMWNVFSRLWTWSHFCSFVDSESWCFLFIRLFMFFHQVSTNPRRRKRSTRTTTTGPWRRSRTSWTLKTRTTRRANTWSRMPTTRLQRTRTTPGQTASRLVQRLLWTDGWIQVEFITPKEKRTALTVKVAADYIRARLY